MQHTWEIFPEEPGPGEQEILHCRALQNLFFIRPLPSKVRDVAGFPNTQKQIEKIKSQNISQMKE